MLEIKGYFQEDLVLVLQSCGFRDEEVQFFRKAITKKCFNVERELQNRLIVMLGDDMGNQKFKELQEIISNYNGYSKVQYEAYKQTIDILNGEEI